MSSARRTSIISTVALALVGLAPLSPAMAAPGGDHPGKGRGKDKALDLTVLATTDVHGNVMDWDYFKNAPYAERSGESVGLARIATAIDQVRAAKGAESTIVVDNGDALQGTPMTYLYGSKDPVTRSGLTHPMAAAYNAIGYDAQVVGNHEFNYGLDLLRTYRSQLRFPLLGANVTDEQPGVLGLKPYTLVNRHVAGHKPVKVGILGLTTPGSAIWDKANVNGRLRFGDMVTAAKRYVPEMRRKGADVVVVLSHSGEGGTSSYGPELPPENVSDVIAREVPGIDVVVAGHSHRDVPQKRIVNEVTGREVLLTQPYRWAASVSQVDLRLVKERGRWAVASSAASSLRGKDLAPNPRVVKAVQPYHDATVAYVNQVVARSSQELSAVESRYKDTPIIDFIQQVQTDEVRRGLAGTPQAALPVLSIAAPFSRTAVFPQGDVTIRDIAGLYIYDNTLEAVQLSGAQVKAYLEHSAGYFATVPAGGTFDPATMTGAGGTPDYNYDIVSGVAYDIDLSRPVGSRITGLRRPDGTPVADTDQFAVAVNNYRRSGGGNFPGISTAPVIYNQQKEIRQLLIDWPAAKGVIDPADFFVPSWRLTAGGVPLVP